MFGASQGRKPKETHASGSPQKSTRTIKNQQESPVILHIELHTGPGWGAAKTLRFAYYDLRDSGSRYQSVFEVSPARIAEFSTPATSRGPPRPDSCNYVFEILPGGIHVRGAAQRQNREGIMPASENSTPPTSLNVYIQIC